MKTLNLNQMEIINGGDCDIADGAILVGGFLGVIASWAGAAVSGGLATPAAAAATLTYAGVVGNSPCLEGR